MTFCLRFLIRAMYFSYNCCYFNKENFNTIFNSEKTVMFNFFTSMIIIAFKFDAAVISIYDSKRVNMYGKVLADTVWYYSKRVIFKTQQHKGNISVF